MLLLKYCDLESIGRPPLAWFPALKDICNMPCNSHKYDDMVTVIKHHTASTETLVEINLEYYFYSTAYDPNYTGITTSTT